MTFLPQSGLKKSTHTNLGSGHTQEVTLDFKLSGLQYEEHGGTCENETGLTSNGTWEGSSLLTAENGAKNTSGSGLRLEAN